MTAPKDPVMAIREPDVTKIPAPMHPVIPMPVREEMSIGLVPG
jgi:hypothetical protein